MKCTSCHDLEVMSSNPAHAVGVRSTSVPSRTWTKNIYSWIMFDEVIITYCSSCSDVQSIKTCYDTFYFLPSLKRNISVIHTLVSFRLLPWCFGLYVYSVCSLLCCSYCVTNTGKCSKQQRFGSQGDGGYEVCLDEKYVPQKNNCIIYSFG